MCTYVLKDTYAYGRITESSFLTLSYNRQESGGWQQKNVERKEKRLIFRIQK